MSNIALKSLKFSSLSDTYTIPQIDAGLNAIGKIAESKATGDAISAVNTKINKLEKLEILDTASGPIASFIDGAKNVPLKSLNVGIEPIQDLHGFASPWPGGGGVNQLNPVEIVLHASTLAGLTLTNNNGIINLSGTWTGSTSGGARALDIPSDIRALNVKGFESTGHVSARWQSGEDTIVFDFANMTNGQTYNMNVGVVVYSGSTAPTAWSPYSNVCPISGWTGATVTGTGKNLLNLDENKMVSVSWDRIFPISLAEGNYVISRSGVYGNGYGTKIILTDASDNTVVTAVPVYSFGQSSSNTSFTFSVTRSEAAKITKIRLQGNNSGITFADIASGKLMIEVGSTVAAFEAYTGHVYPITWQSEAGTVYGGTLDVTNGEMRATKGIKDLGDLTWTKSTSYNNPIFYASISGMVTGRLKTAISDTYKFISGANAADIANNNGNAVFGMPNANAQIIIRDDAFALSDATAFTTGVTGKKVVYELATPIEYTLTPEQVVTLLGQNNIWADTGNTEVEYYADTKLYINKVVAALA